jgi:DNA-binding NtrC family response regulator
MMASPILIVDDDTSVITSLALLLKQAGYSTRSATTPAQAMEQLNDGPIGAVLQDMNFSRQTSGEEGIALLRQIKSHNPDLPVILMTGWGSISLAVQGVKAGAADFITKPWTNEQLLQSVRTALGLAEAGVRNSTRKTPTREELDTQYDFSNIIGNDPQLIKALEVAGRVSATDASVLITGESGAGKELVAEAIHRNSLRRAKPFIKVNIGGISQALFDSELFGHVRGAFTDARQDRKGRFDAAEGGTIFLDEIGDLDLSCQVKMLRVLQDRAFEPLGSSETRVANVRVVSATNTDLKEAIVQGKFREDLFYRLNLITIHLPPLRERRGDIPLLANFFLHSIADLHKKARLALSDEAMAWLQNLQWHGNIRQFRHLIERAVLMSRHETLGIEDFSASLSMEREGAATEALPPVGSATLDEIERAMILKSIDHFHGNVSKVAESLGLSRAALYRRFEKFGIKS